MKKLKNSPRTKSNNFLRTDGLVEPQRAGGEAVTDKYFVIKKLTYCIQIVNLTKGI